MEKFALTGQEMLAVRAGVPTHTDKLRPYLVQHDLLLLAIHNGERALKDIIWRICLAPEHYQETIGHSLAN